MIINDNKALIQIPKCGTMTTMAMSRNNHCVIFNKTFYNIHMKYKDGVKDGYITPDMTVYAIKRDPYNRLCSSFLFRKLRGRRFKPRVDTLKRQFEMFVMHQLEGLINQALNENKGGMVHYFVTPMYNYIEGCPEDKLRIIDLDDKVEFKAKLEEFFGKSFEDKPVPKNHKSLGYSSYMDFYTPEMIRKVNTIYKKDFEYFGYEQK